MTWQRVFSFVSTYGYAFLFLASVAENVFLLGIIVPGDLAIVLGGVLAARGYLEPVGVAIVVALGVLLGSCFSFWLGRRGGPSFVAWCEAQLRARRAGARLSRAPKSPGATAADYFRAHGAKTVFLASFVAGVRNAVPVLAGASDMGFTRFVLYGAAGSIIRSCLLVGIGYVFGANLERAAKTLASVNGWALVVAGACAVTIFLVRRARTRRLVREAGTISEDRVDREEDHDLRDAPEAHRPEAAPTGAKGASLTSPSSRGSSPS
jgi:membrane protein DedA with SNARE-associated domain